MDTKKIKIKKDLQYYLNLPWTYTVQQDVDNDKRKIYVVRIAELPGVSTDGYTISEAMDNIKEALTLTIEVSLKHGDPIPEPVDIDDYKGNIAYRTTPQRHHRIAREAEKQRMSLSKLIDNLVDTSLSKSKSK